MYAVKQSCIHFRCDTNPAPPDPACEAPEEYMFFPNTGKSYKPHFEEVTMAEAFKTCQSEGGSLLMPRTPPEYDSASAMQCKFSWMEPHSFACDKM